MNLHSGYPFWLIKNGLPYNYPKLEESFETEVVVLGGGISGALVAYYLTNAGVQCSVIDARSIGLGSTCASTSLLQYEIDTPLSKLKNMVGIENAVRSYQLCVEAIDKIKSISHKLKFTDFKSKKSLYYSAFKKDISFLKEEFVTRKKTGFKVSYLEEDEILTLFNFKSGGAILSQVGAELDAYSFTQELHQSSIKKGARIFDRTPVLKIDHQKNGVVVHTENGNKVKAKKIVYATGYEVVNFIDKKIVNLHSTYAVISEQFNSKVDFWNKEALIWNTADPYLYMRTTADKRILVGGRDEDFFNTTRRDKLINRKRNQLIKDFSKVFPSIPFKPEFTWSGTFGSTADGLPFIGTYEKFPNSYFALGFGGNGITFSLIAAEIITDLVTGKANSDQQIFSFNRV